ncbi:MAG: hypothetical protein HYS81_05240 [Candidatus Aenigmatarchaeota archaeon]|nr:MAG: hypothetical protein HYS81_05240 [Candidatus Aenigmarchaeota archaeon]
MESTRKDVFILAVAVVAGTLALSSVTDFYASIAMTAAMLFSFTTLTHVAHFRKISASKGRTVARLLSALVHYVLVFMLARVVADLLSPPLVADSMLLGLVALQASFLFVFLHVLGGAVRILEDTTTRLEAVLERSVRLNQPGPWLALIVSFVVGASYTVSVFFAGLPAYGASIIAVNMLVVAGLFWLSKRDYDTFRQRLPPQDKEIINRLYLSSVLLLDFVLMSGLQEMLYPRAGRPFGAIAGGVQLAAIFLAFFVTSYIVRKFKGLAR